MTIAENASFSLGVDLDRSKPRSPRHPSARLAQALFSYLEKFDISYVVVGDTRSYDSVIGSDIDLIVENNTLQTMALLLRTFCKEVNGRIVQALQHETGAWYYVLSVTSQDVAFFLSPDVCADYRRRGRCLLQASELLNSATRGDQSFFVPASPNAFIYYLLKKIDKLELNPRQFEYLRLEWSKDRQCSLEEVKRFWGHTDASRIAHSLDKNDFEQLRTDIPQLQAALDKGLNVSGSDRLAEFVRKARRTIYPTGISIVFLGADGAGKSSVIHQIEQTLAPVFRRSRRYHLRPHFGHENGDARPVKDPHGAPLRNPIASLAQLALWWLDYTWGYIVDIRWRLVRSTMVVFDRYFDDLLVDPRRYRFGGALRLAKCVARSVPRPHLVIMLDAPSEVLQSRKQEVPVEETTRQRHAYLDLARTLPNAHVVDASRPLDEVVAKVEGIILEYMAERTARRLGIDRS